jgi:transposase-like protein
MTAPPSSPILPRARHLPDERAPGAPGTPPAGGVLLARQMAEAGASRAEIARAMGLHYSSLTRLARRHGIAFRDARAGAGRTCVRRDQWRALHDQGLTAHEAAAALGATVRAAWEAARRGGYRFAKKAAPDPLPGKIARLIASGCWQREAARRLGMDARSVARIAQRHGLTFPPCPRPEPKPKAAPRPSPMDGLTEAERADARLFMRKGLRRDEAVRVVLEDRAHRQRRAA